MTGKTLVALAAAMAFALPTMASAGSNNFDVIVDGQTGAETRTLAVSLGDLNLGTPRGYRTADSRLDRAAKKVCGFAHGSIMPATREYRGCYQPAIEGARSDLDTMVQALRQG